MVPRLKELIVQSWGLESKFQHPVHTHEYSFQETDIVLGRNNEKLPVIWRKKHLQMYGKNAKLCSFKI